MDLNKIKCKEQFEFALLTKRKYEEKRHEEIEFQDFSLEILLKILLACPSTCMIERKFSLMKWKMSPQKRCLAKNYHLINANHSTSKSFFEMCKKVANEIDQ